MPYPEDDSDDFGIKAININLDLYRNFAMIKLMNGINYGNC